MTIEKYSARPVLNTSCRESETRVTNFCDSYPSSPLTEKAFMQHLEEALKGDVPVICEFKVVDGQWQLRDLQFETVTRTSNEDDLCYILSIVCDLMDKKVLDRKPQEAGDKADVATEAKRQFIANISHEMRTPLWCDPGIHGFATAAK